MISNYQPTSPQYYGTATLNVNETVSTYPLYYGFDTVWSNSNVTTASVYPDVGFNRRLARLEEAIRQLGRKLAMTRHLNILWAKALIDEAARWCRRLGAPPPPGLRSAPQRRGRVCGEANYYRTLLC